MIEVFVEGEPRGWSSRPKARRKAAPWRADVRRKLEGIPSLKGSYRVQLSFFLPSDRFQGGNSQNTQAADIDNLVKPVLDIMGRTLLADGDGAVRDLRATKQRVEGVEKAGVLITVFPDTVPEETDSER